MPHDRHAQLESSTRELEERCQSAFAIATAAAAAQAQARPTALQLTQARKDSKSATTCVEKQVGLLPHKAATTSAAQVQGVTFAGYTT